MFLNSPMDVTSMDDTVSQIEDAIYHQQFIQHVVVNVAKLVNMQQDHVLATSVTECDIINIDGMGVVWGARFCGHKVSERVAGIDLFHRLVEMSADRSLPIFLLGAQEEVVTKVAKTLSQQHSGLTIAGYHHGYFWDDEQAVVDKIKKSEAKLLFVAITSPRKENFINKWQNELNVNFVMGVGGTFDVVAGKVKRSPKWMQSSGLEWLYRIIQEPKRMWKRYLITNSTFAWLIIREKSRILFSSRRSPPNSE